MGGRKPPAGCEENSADAERFVRTGPAVPIDIFNDIVARWLVADQYFKDVAHHQRNNINDAEFGTHMTFIENFLLQRLQPQAIADQDAIDALIAEAEHGQ